MEDKKKLKELVLELNNLKDDLSNQPIKSIATGIEGRIVDLKENKLYVSFCSSGSIPLSIDEYKNRLVTDNETNELINTYKNLVSKINKLKKGCDKNA